MDGSTLRVANPLRKASTHRRASQSLDPHNPDGIAGSQGGSKKLRRPSASSKMRRSSMRRGRKSSLMGGSTLPDDGTTSTHPNGPSNSLVSVVLDGIDVTPQPLGARGSDAVKAGAGVGGGVPAASVMGSSFRMMAGGSDSVSDAGSQSMDWSSQFGSQMLDSSQISDSDQSTTSPTGSETGSFVRGYRRRNQHGNAAGNYGNQNAGNRGKIAEGAEEPEEEEEELREEDLDMNVNITLRETETIWIVDFPATCVGRESAEAQAVTEANARYQNLLKHRIGNDSYVDRSMQTFDYAPKNKDVQKNPVVTEETGCMATVWDIYDTHAEEERLAGEEDRRQMDQLNLGEEDDTAGAGGADAEAPEEEPDEIDEALGSELVDDMTESASVSHSQSSMMVSRRGGRGGRSESTMTGVHPHAGSISSRAGDGSHSFGGEIPLDTLRGLSRKLRVVEHMITQNVFHGKHVEYRDFVTDEAKEKRRRHAIQLARGLADDSAAPAGESYKARPELHHLWSFSCENAKSKNVSCLAWSHQNMDLLAAGYGSFSFASQTPGAVLCWSLKNPEFPDRVYPTSCGVTAVDFSRVHPYLLAVALYDGSIAIYDVRKTKNKPILVSTHATGKHSEPAWCVRWVDRGADKGEYLISMSTDGRVTQWSLRKGMEFTDLMRLKRVSTGKGESKGEAFISRLASGMAFDFLDTDIYVAGTEDGSIHKCSCSYNEQYLDTFSGHTGPVYQIVVSPFHDNVFLSASADWTVRLWDIDTDDAKLVFEKGSSFISDVCWSPHNSTVFATVTGDGRLDVWDLTVSSIDPVSSASFGAQFSRVAFAHNAPVIVVGDDMGRIHVHKLKNVETPSLNREQMRARLEEAIKANSEGAKVKDDDGGPPQNGANPQKEL